MSTLRTYQDRPIAPRFLDRRVFVRAPGGAAPAQQTTLRDALESEAVEGGALEDIARGEVLAVCDDDAPGVWYVPVQYTVPPSA